MRSSVIGPFGRYRPLRQLVSLAAALLLTAAVTDLALRPSIFSAPPDADPASFSDPSSWSDIVASVCALLASWRMQTAERLLRAQLILRWSPTGIFSTPEGSRTEVRPALIFFGAIAGLYGVEALFSCVLLPLNIASGALAWRALAQGVLRPLVAWRLLALVADSFPSTNSCGSAV